MAPSNVSAPKVKVKAKGVVTNPWSIEAEHILYGETEGTVIVVGSDWMERLKTQINMHVNGVLVTAKKVWCGPMDEAPAGMLNDVGGYMDVVLELDIGQKGHVALIEFGDYESKKDQQ